MNVFSKQLSKRLLQLVITLFGISIISFLLMYISPIDPVRQMFAVSGSIPSEEVLEAMREELGLNLPIYQQYWNWLTGCLQGDFGTSLSQGLPVTQLLSNRLWPTMALAGLSVVLMLCIAIPMGIFSALYKNTWVDTVMRGFSFVAISMPNFWVGLLLLYLFAVQLGWVSVVSNTLDFAKMILPALTLAIAMAGKYARQVRASVLEEMGQDYVIGAQARGISNRKILWRHVVPNAMLPLVTLLGLSIGSLLGGTAVVEVIFGYPALGSLAISAITAMDYPLIQGYVIWIALTYMLVNLLVDISYGKLDPRLKEVA